MANERYQHELWTGSGSTKATFQFQESGDVECELHLRWMGSGERHYHLSGEYERITDTYGRIFIRQASIQQADRPSQSATLSEIQAEEVDLTALGDLMYESLKVARSPVLYHPDDSLYWMSLRGFARWNKFFDVMLITSSYVIQRFEDLRSDVSEAPDKHLLEHYGDLLFMLDKMKFTSITEASPMEMLDATDHRAVDQLVKSSFLL